MRLWSRTQWVAAAGGAVLLLLVLGVPTVLIPNSLFAREIEPTWWSYPVWLATAVLGGALLATYVGPQRPRACPTAGRKGTSGGVLAWFAIGCPVCNKLVLLALGTSGTLHWFAPLQPLLGVLGVLLLALALRARLREQPRFPMPASGPPSNGRSTDSAGRRSRSSTGRTAR